MEFLIIWFIFGAICAAIAGKKNKSQRAWFLCGCVFGIFALGVRLLSGPDGMVKCPSCAELILAEARV